MKTTRCKMTVQSLKKYDDRGNVTQIHVELAAVTDNSTPENNAFWEATPCGSMSLDVNNVGALPEGIEVGDDFYVDLIAIPNQRKG